MGTRTSRRPPLVLVHGWGLDARIWDPLRERLDAHGRTYAPTLRGFGPTRLDTDSPFEEHVEQLLTFLEEVGEPAIVVGHSRGGAIAVEAAARNPERVGALVVIAMGSRATAADDWPHGLPAALFADVADRMDAAFVETFDALLGTFWLNDDPAVADVEGAAGLIKAAVRTHADPAGVVRILRADADIDIRARAPHAAVPALVLRGSVDAVRGAEGAADLARRLPHGELGTIDGAGHVPQLTRPDRTAEAIVAFLRKHRLLEAAA